MNCSWCAPRAASGVASLPLAITTMMQYVHLPLSCYRACITAPQAAAVGQGGLHASSPPEQTQLAALARLNSLPVGAWHLLPPAGPAVHQERYRVGGWRMYTCVQQAEQLQTCLDCHASECVGIYRQAGRQAGRQAQARSFMRSHSCVRAPVVSAAQTEGAAALVQTRAASA